MKILNWSIIQVRNILNKWDKGHLYIIYNTANTSATPISRIFLPRRCSYCPWSCTWKRDFRAQSKAQWSPKEFHEAAQRSSVNNPAIAVIKRPPCQGELRPPLFRSFPLRSGKTKGTPGVEKKRGKRKSKGIMVITLERSICERSTRRKESAFHCTRWIKNEFVNTVHFEGRSYGSGLLPLFRGSRDRRKRKEKMEDGRGIKEASRNIFIRERKIEKAAFGSFNPAIFLKLSLGVGFRGSARKIPVALENSEACVFE